MLLPELAKSPGFSFHYFLTKPGKTGMNFGVAKLKFSWDVAILGRVCHLPRVAAQALGYLYLRKIC